LRWPAGQSCDICVAITGSLPTKADNPAVHEARRRRIPVVPRALMLAELMRL
jgi:UDP-N-acetylmuramate--alanine ligase